MATGKRKADVPFATRASRVEDMTPQERRLSQIVEFQLSITPRGRSVVTGSMLIEGKIQSFKKELDHDEKLIFMEGLAYVLNLPKD